MDVIERFMRDLKTRTDREAARLPLPTDTVTHDLACGHVLITHHASTSLTLKRHQQTCRQKATKQ